MITYIGQFTIGEAVPGAAIAVNAGIGGIGLAMPDLQGRISALQAQLAALATMPPFPTFGEMIAQASFNLVQLELAIAVPNMPPPPSIAAVIATFEALVAALLATLGNVQGQLSAIVAVQTLLARGGVRAFAFSGDRTNIGSELQAAVNTEIGGAGTAHALVLATTSGTTWSTMGQVFKVAP